MNNVLSLHSCGTISLDYGNMIQQPLDIWTLMLSRPTQPTK